MLSYKQWKMVNESVLPSFNLGLGRPSNLGIQSQFGFDEGMHKKNKKKMKGEDTDLVEPAEAKDKPDVDVELDDKDHKPHKGKKGKHKKGHCAKCGAMCGAMAKKHGTKKCKMCKMESFDYTEMHDDEDMIDDEEVIIHDDEEGHDHDEEDHDEEGHDHDEEDHDEEGHDHDEEDHDEEDHDEEDHDEEGGDEEGGDEEGHDHDEEGHDEEDMPHMEAKMYGKKKMKHMKHMKHMGSEMADKKKMKYMGSEMADKKKMLKGGQKKLDVSGPEGKPDGKITGHDFAELRKRKHGKHDAKNHDDKKHDAKKHIKKEEAAWWKSVNSMLEGGNPDTKFSSGCESLFTSVDQENLYVSLRDES